MEVFFFVLIYFLVVAFFGFLALITQSWLIITIILVLYWIFRKPINKFFQRLWKRKIYAIGLVILAIFGIGILFIQSIHSAMNRYSEKVYSPDRKYFVQIEETNCGAMCRYNTSVIITDTKIPFWTSENKKAGVFGLDASMNSVSPSWVDNHTLKIKFNYCSEIYGQVKQWKDIKIVYEGKCSER